MVFSIISVYFNFRFMDTDGETFFMVMHEMLIKFDAEETVERFQYISCVNVPTVSLIFTAVCFIGS